MSAQEPRLLSAWEAEFSILYFQHLQNRSRKMYVHAVRTGHALPDLRIAAGRLRDGVSVDRRQRMKGKEWSRPERAALKVGHRDSEFF
jgi:hypothetical protein